MKYLCHCLHVHVTRHRRVPLLIGSDLLSETDVTFYNSEAMFCLSNEATIDDISQQCFNLDFFVTFRNIFYY